MDKGVIDIIIPWTLRTARCKKNLAFVIERLKRQHGTGKIVVVQSGKHPVSLPNGTGVEHHWLGLEANRSWAANYGFHKTETELVALLDSDMLLPWDAFDIALQDWQKGKRGGKLSLGFQDLTAEESDRFLELPADVAYAAPKIPSRGGGKCAGAFWLTRELWIAVGGMNELYYPTGLEDADMAFRIEALLDDPGQWGEGAFPAMHLFHPHASFPNRNWQRPMGEFLKSIKDSPEAATAYVEQMPKNFGSPNLPNFRIPSGVPVKRPILPDINFGTCGGASVDIEALDWILENVPAGSTILEIGSGRISGELAKVYEVYSIEDNPEWLNRYDGVNYIHAPLVEYKIPFEWMQPEIDADPKLGLWYDPEQLIGKLPEEYDLLIIDGPYWSRQRVGIVPNFALFKDRTCAFLIDDSHRKAEKQMTMFISEQVGRPFENFYPENSRKEFAVIRKEIGMKAKEILERLEARFDKLEKAFADLAAKVIVAIPAVGKLAEAIPEDIEPEPSSLVEELEKVEEDLREKAEAEELAEAPTPEEGGGEEAVEGEIASSIEADKETADHDDLPTEPTPEEQPDEPSTPSA